MGGGGPPNTPLRAVLKEVLKGSLVDEVVLQECVCVSASVCLPLSLCLSVSLSLSLSLALSWLLQWGVCSRLDGWLTGGDVSLTLSLSVCLWSVCLSLSLSLWLCLPLAQSSPFSRLVVCRSGKPKSSSNLGFRNSPACDCASLWPRPRAPSKKWTPQNTGVTYTTVA